MFKAEDLAAWLDANGAPAEIVYAYHHTPMSPDEVTTITPGPSPFSREAEEALEYQVFQIKCRSGRNEAGTERDTIFTLDQILIDDELYPYTNDSGKYVLTNRRLGGPPQFMKVDQQHRAEFVCNYLMKLER